MARQTGPFNPHLVWAFLGALRDASDAVYNDVTTPLPAVVKTALDVIRTRAGEVSDKTFIKAAYRATYENFDPETQAGLRNSSGDPDQFDQKVDNNEI